MIVKIGDLVYSGLGNLGIIKAEVEYSYNQFGDHSYMVEWLNGSSMVEKVHEATIEAWRENYIVYFEPDKYILDSTARL